MTEVAYGQYAEAYKAIHSALSDIAAPPPGKKTTRMEFSWNLDGSVKTIKFYDSEELLFTLTFDWNPDGTLKTVDRS